MKLVIYAESDVVTAQPEVLVRLQAGHDLRAVILRAAEPAAFSLVSHHGLDALWLAPGLWGAVTPDRRHTAEFPEVNQWSHQPLPAFESQWPMYCPTNHDLAAELAIGYAVTATQMGASGIYCTHLRFHHPADVAQLWGCLCSRCQTTMVRFGLTIEELETFWTRLAHRLHALPVVSWPGVDRTAGAHGLLNWWASLTDSDFPQRWFEWKNATLRRFFSTLADAFREAAPGMSFASNTFEPLLAPLVGHATTTTEMSEWYSPLLGYWPTHVRQSGLNLATWHARLAKTQDVDAAVVALEAVLSAPGVLRDEGACITSELQTGADIAAHLHRPYWPVLNGTNGAGISLHTALDMAEQNNASGVVLQGISQLFGGDRTLDAWV